MSQVQRRLPGGLIPSKTAIACCFFGPLLAKEFCRYEYALADAAAATGISVERAKANLSGLSRLLRLTLPPQFTVPIQRVQRTKGGGFDLPIDRYVIRELKSYAFDVQPAAPDADTRAAADSADRLRFRNAMTELDYAELWRQLFIPNLGAGYQALASYKKLMATIATICSGMGLLLADSSEGRRLVEQAARIWENWDMDVVTDMATRTGVSEGVVLACVVQFAGRGEKSVAMRAAALGRGGDFTAFQSALWEPFFPKHETHPYFKLFEEKVTNRDLRPKVGRPQEVELEKVVRPPEPAADPELSPTAAPPPIPLAPPAEPPAPALPPSQPSEPPRKLRLFGKTERV